MGVPPSVRAWVAPPEWRPRALGGSVVVPEPERRGPSLLAPPDRAGDWLIALQFALVVTAASYFIYAAGNGGGWPVAALGAAILALVIAWGVAHDRRVRRQTVGQLSSRRAS